jgi:hypothetical protein
MLEHFIHLGPFNRILNNRQKLKDKNGLYIWVLHSNLKRIIYIGTATGSEGLYDRLSTELREIKNGLHTIIRLESNDLDPYDYLRNDILSNEKLNELYKERRSWLWIPNGQNKNIFGDLFDNSWKDYVENIYIKKLLHIYYIELPDTRALNLETQLQLFIKHKENIGYYKASGQGMVLEQSWLGKPQIAVNELSEFNFNLNDEIFVKLNHHGLDFGDFQEFWSDKLKD